MKEKIFNIFVYVKDGIIFELGAMCYRRNGSDAEKTEFLREKAWNDYRAALRFKLPDRCVLVHDDGTSERRRMTYNTFREYTLAQQHMQFLEEIFQELGAGRDPVICITPIVDGAPRVEAIHNFATTSERK